MSIGREQEGRRRNVIFGETGVKCVNNGTANVNCGGMLRAREDLNPSLLAIFSRSTKTVLFTLICSH